MIFKVFQIALVASRLGQFCENFENTREIGHFWVPLSLSFEASLSAKVLLW